MDAIIYKKSTGRVVKFLNGMVDSIVEANCAEDEAWVAGVGEPDKSYYENGEIKNLPQSIPFHEWNWETKTWQPNSAAAIAAKLHELQQERTRRLFAPCNGFDADQLSRERITGMILRLQRGDGLPTGWVGWRDAENQMHWTHDDAATVLANLTELSRAIEDREQALLVASWIHKSNIEALTDIDAILAYDVSANWL